MFGLGGGELFVVVLLAVLLIGPKDLPKAASALGRWVRQLKSAVGDFKETVEKEISDDG
jgi:sec-independent protein translocase protein TatA